MATELTRIGEKARSDPQLVFTSLYHHICDVDNLRACYDSTARRRQWGGWRNQGAVREEPRREPSRTCRTRLKRMGYRPGPKRRSYIPKPGSEKGRPLGISNFEDKIVELAVKRVLEPIYEAVFEDSSHGYRPGRSQHQCLDALGERSSRRRVNHVVEADIQKFLRQSQRMNGCSSFCGIASAMSGSFA
jgi:RNA-directed DNA polymerase